MCQCVSVSALDIISFASDVGLKWRLDLERPFLVVEHEEKEMQTFSSSFRQEALLLNVFLRDSRNHAINPSVVGKNQTFKPRFHGALRTT